MSLNRRSVCALFALAGFVVAVPAARADDPPKPDDILARALEAITQLADRCAADNDTAAGRAADQIAKLLADGKKRQALRLGRQAAEQINQHSENCLKQIRNLREGAVRRAHRAGATREMLRGFSAAVEAQGKRVRDSRVEAVQKIRAALAGGG